MILSTSALRKFNITRDTQSPDGGVISKGADGEPTGEIFDNAKALVTIERPKPVSIDDVLATQKTLNPYGITAVRIPGSYKGDMLEEYKLIKDAATRDCSRCAIRFLLPGFRHARSARGFASLSMPGASSRTRATTGCGSAASSSWSTAGSKAATCRSPMLSRMAKAANSAASRWCRR